MTTNLLMDAMKMNGKGLTGAKGAIDLLAGATKSISVISNSSKDVAYDGIYHLESYDSETGILVAIASATGQKISIKDVNTALGDEADNIVEEILNTTSMMMRFYGKTYFISNFAFFTLSQRLGLGDAIYVNCPERDAFIAQIMMREPKSWKLCTRKLGNSRGQIYKVFAVHSGAYEHISQELLIEICEGLCSQNNYALFGSKGKVGRYEIDHDITQIVVEYPDAAKEVAAAYGLKDMIPCVRMITSDTGKSSFVFQALWKKNSSYSVCESIRVSHRGVDANRESILPKINEKLFPAYTKLPERLVELMDIVIFPAKAPQDTKKEMEELLRKIHKESKFVKFLTKKTEIRVRELMVNDFDYSVPITAFDIASQYLDLPSRIHGLSSADLKNLEKVCGQIPYVKCLDEQKEETEEEKSLYLSA